MRNLFLKIIFFFIINCVGMFGNSFFLLINVSFVDVKFVIIIFSFIKLIIVCVLFIVGILIGRFIVFDCCCLIMFFVVLIVRFFGVCIGVFRCVIDLFL